MAGVLARVLYALLLASVLGLVSWVSFSRFVLGKSLEVPDLRGRAVEEASAQAAERGLHLVVDPAQAAYDDDVPIHQIRGQSPAPQTAVKAGQDVRVFLSLGPRIVRAPDLAGLSPRTAALALAKAGLAEGVVSSARLPGPPGTVAQGIAPGTAVKPDGQVDLLVNRGAVETAWVMPDLIGRDFERVRLAFEVRGFKLGNVKAQSYEGAAAGTILRQFPLAGHPVTMRDSLSFVVASPEAPPT
jgi:eukaryotic-like serine/threonine-protein kinase